MKNKKIIIKSEVNKEKLKLGVFVLLSLFTIITPIMIYFSMINMPLEAGISIDGYISKLRMVTILLVIIGIFISSLAIFSLLFKTRLKIKLFIRILLGIIYCFYIIVMSNSGNLEIKGENTIISVDYSLLYYFLIIVPIVGIAFASYSFIIKRDEFKEKMLILKAINEARSTNSENQIRKYILKMKEYQNFKPEKRKNIIKNLKPIISRLENENMVVFNKKRGYKLTRKGKGLLNIHYKLISHMSEIKFIDTHVKVNKKTDANLINGFEVWTEKQLGKITHKKKMKI